MVMNINEKKHTSITDLTSKASSKRSDNLSDQLLLRALSKAILPKNSIYRIFS